MAVLPTHAGGAARAMRRRNPDSIVKLMCAVTLLAVCSAAFNLAAGWGASGSKTREQLPVGGVRHLLKEFTPLEKVRTARPLARRAGAARRGAHAGEGGEHPQVAAQCVGLEALLLRRPKRAPRVAPAPPRAARARAGVRCGSCAPWLLGMRPHPPVSLLRRAYGIRRCAP
jgi:hypothetical protein